MNAKPLLHIGVKAVSLICHGINLKSNELINLVVEFLLAIS